MTTETFDVDNVDIVYRDDLSLCIVPFQNKMAEGLYNAADVIVFASGVADKSCLAGNLRFTRERNKNLFYIGTKGFGYNENWIIRLKPGDRSNQWNQALSDSLASDAEESQIVPKDNYISLMKPIVRDGSIPITDAEGRLLSVDREHITRFGAIFFGQRVLLESRYARDPGAKGSHASFNRAGKLGQSSLPARIPRQSPPESAAARVPPPPPPATPHPSARATSPPRTQRCA